MRLLVIALVALASPAAADTSSGNYYLPHCQRMVRGDADFLTGACFGQVVAIDDLRDVLLPGLRWCTPEGVTRRQVVRVVVRWMEGNPNQLHLPLWAIAQLALRAAWPCQ
jgi:Rap1a immunity proteins